VQEAGVNELACGPDLHVVGQGIIARAPEPMTALCDGAQALRLEQVPQLVEYVGRVRNAYERVCELAR
jgi:3-deoxy-7-phosphoheptulonate synthase